MGGGGDRMRGVARSAGVVAGLALVLALASGGSPIWLPSGAAILDRGTLLPFVVALFAVGVILATGFALTAHRLYVLPRQGPRPVRHTLLRSVAPTAVILVCATLFAIAGGRIGAPPEDPEVQVVRAPSLIGQALLFKDPRQSPAKAGPGEADAPEVLSPEPRLGVIASLALIAFLLGAGAWWLSGRRGHQQGPDPADDARPEDAPPDRVATRRAVVRSIDEMLADPDPDTAVIGAYARLLEGLAEAGSPRRSHEGPVEHLRRVLTTLQVRAEPLRALVRLFETARFSATALTDAHRAQALEALRAVADDLSAPGGAATAVRA